MCKSAFNPEKMYTYILGFANGAGMTETRKALVYARAKHEGQFRKSGDPYIVHPLTMCCNALSLGIHDDYILATILLHDVCEDCMVGLNDLPVCDEVKRGVELMTFTVLEGETKEEANDRYYRMLRQSREAVFTKLIDRCHNVSSMAGVFSREKLLAYIEETRRYVYPLLRDAKHSYPGDTNMVFLLKYQMVSVIDSIEATMQAYEQIDA